MFENDFLSLEKPEKQEFVKTCLTILLCALTLIVSANLTPLFYLMQTSKSSLSLEELSTYFGKNTFFTLQLIPFSLTLITLLLCYKFIHKKEVFSLFTSRSRFDLKRFSLSFFVWLAVLMGFLLFKLNQSNSTIKWNFSSSFFMLLLISISFLLLQCVFEEVFFRSFLLKKLFQGTKNKLVAAIISSLLFGFMHYNNPEIRLLGTWVLIYFVGTGLFLALLTIWDKGLELSIGFHTANNLFASLILTNNWQIFQTDALYKDYAPLSYDYTVWINLFIIFPLLIFLYGKIFKWDFGLIIANFTKKSNP